MAGAVVVVVEVLGIVEVGAADGFGEGVLLVWSGDEVDVVGHEAPGQDVEAVFVGLFSEHGKVGAVVFVGVEDLLAIVTALGDVMGHTGDNDSCVSGHEGY